MPEPVPLQCVQRVRDAVDALVQRVVRSNRARVVTGIDEPGCEVAWSIEERIAAQVSVVGGKRGLQMADGKIRAGNGVAHVREHGSVVESKVLGAIRKGAPSHRPMGQHITGEHQPCPTWCRMLRNRNRHPRSTWRGGRRCRQMFGRRHSAVDADRLARRRGHDRSARVHSVTGRRRGGPVLAGTAAGPHQD